MKTPLYSTKYDSAITNTTVARKSAICQVLLPVLLLAALFILGCAAKEVPPPPPPVVVVPPPPPPGEDVVQMAKANLGVPYRYGGISPKTGFDCSGLVCWSFEQVGVKVPRIARDQLKAGVKVESRDQLRPGDIVVFKGTRSRSGWHSGIYSGNGKFVHSPSKGKTVRESKLSESYFAKRYAGGRRIPRTGESALRYAEGIIGRQDTENLWQGTENLWQGEAQPVSAPSGKSMPAKVKTKTKSRAAQPAKLKAKAKTKTTPDASPAASAKAAPVMAAQTILSPRAPEEGKARNSSSAAGKTGTPAASQATASMETEDHAAL
jgi:hypothetical protein